MSVATVHANGSGAECELRDLGRVSEPASADDRAQAAQSSRRIRRVKRTALLGCDVNSGASSILYRHRDGHNTVDHNKLPAGFHVLAFFGKLGRLAESTHTFSANGNH